MTTEKTVTLWIDGVQVTVPEKTTILEAADSINIRIPRLCYHPDLSIVGRLPRVPGRGGGPAQPGARLLLPGGGRDEGHAPRRCCCAGCAATWSN